MGAGKIALEGIDAGGLAAVDDFDPGVLAVLLHDRGDEDAVGIFVFDLFELIEPGIEGAVADELDVFPADDFVRIGRSQAAVAGLNVDDLGGVEADCFADDGAPAFIEGLADDVGIRAGRA